MSIKQSISAAIRPRGRMAGSFFKSNTKTHTITKSNTPTFLKLFDVFHWFLKVLAVSHVVYHGLLMVVSCLLDGFVMFC